MKKLMPFRFLRYALIIICFLSVYLIAQNASSAPQMADYCYLPPFVTDPNTPPNVLIVYEKSADILKRAYSTTYDDSPTTTYYGFFDANSYYAYDTTNNYFVRSTTCTPSATSLNCFPGEVLNWALMSSLDLSRRALVGFGWPDVGAATSAGEVFTYTGNYNNGSEPITYGQWRSGNSTSVSYGADFDNNGTADYTYAFCISQATGSNPTGLTIRVKSGTAAPSCTGSCTGTCTVIKSGGQVAMKFTTEQRYGLIQKYIDTDKDLKYDTDAPMRLAIRRWHSGNDKQEDIMKNTALTDAERSSYFKSILTAISKAPPDDPSTAYLGGMMADIVDYISGSSCSYCDNDAWTQTPYSWSTDPAKECRKTIALFITTGTYLGEDADKLTPLPADCSGLTYTDAFPTNTCYAYHTDLSTEAGTQNIMTYVIHTSFYGSGAANADRLKYAASGDVGGGEYLSVDNPEKFEAALEEAFLNILSSASSASTVATLTTQTRESSTLTQAYFYPRDPDNKMLKWIGYLRLLWSDTGANLREDTNNTGWLDLMLDDILSFYYDDISNSYKAKTYSDSDGDLKIDSCSTYTDKTNDQVSAIWNAQTMLLNRTPLETDTSTRTIKIGIDANNSGIVKGSEANEMVDFTTALDSTLQPFWNYTSYCSNNISRWCSVTADCNYCTINTTRTCPGGTNDECYYCSGRTTIVCSGLGTATDCYFDYGTCDLTTQYCTNNLSAVCTLDTDCTAYEVCDTTTTFTCVNNPAISCTVNADCAGTCKGTCTGNTSRSCSVVTDCIDDYGICTADTCVTAGFTCEAECDANCAESVIKFVRGFDKPTPSGGSFRIRHECTADADCPSGTCDTSTGICSDASSDITKTLKLGDIVYSTPRISPNSGVNSYDLRYSDSSYKTFIESTAIADATPIVIVGANDGMIHAFKVSKIKDIDPPGTADSGKQVAMFADNPTADTTPPTDLGKELWAYIPYNSVPFLRWYCKEGYCHIPMVDARFTIVDASIGTDSTDDATARASDGSTWKRLLIGAMGVGGKSITVGSKTWSSSVFVLDITNPSSPSLLWERPLPDNTLTTSNPAIVRLGADDKNGTWYVVFGSGPESVTTNKLNYKSSGAAMIYVFNLETGALAGEINTNTASIGVVPTGVAIGDMMAVDMDDDYQVDDIYFGTYTGTDSTLSGGFYRLRINNNGTYQTTITDWDITRVINTGRPVFAGADIAVDAYENIWIYFGTGLYLTLEHASVTTDNEYIYGFMETEECWKGSGTCNEITTLLDTTSAAFTGADATELGCMCAGNIVDNITCTSPGTCPGSCGTDEDTIVIAVTGATLSGSGTTCDTKQDEEAINCLVDEVRNNYQGWKVALSGHKIFARPFVAGGLVDFTSFEPTSDVCSLGGDTYLISLHYTTGTAYIQPTLYLEGGTTGAYSSVTVKALASLGTGVPPLGESLVALPLSGDTYKVITQVSGGLPGTTLSPSLPATTGYVLWISK
ncbi:MAG: hypothetical protein AB1610_03425 [Nitrospirota bacterium]